jgi:hypothetical protein
MLSKLVVASLAFAATGMVCNAAAAQETGLVGCIHMGKQLSQALDANAQSPNYDDAHDLKLSGSEFCRTGLYALGLQRYTRALELLGTGTSTSMNTNPNPNTSKN